MDTDTVFFNALVHKKKNKKKSNIDYNNLIDIEKDKSYVLKKLLRFEFIMHTLSYQYRKQVEIRILQATIRCVFPLQRIPLTSRFFDMGKVIWKRSLLNYEERRCRKLASYRATSDPVGRSFEMLFRNQFVLIWACSLNFIKKEKQQEKKMIISTKKSEKSSADHYDNAT